MKRLIIIFIIVLVFTLGVMSLVWAQSLDPNPAQCALNPNMPGCTADPNPPACTEDNNELCNPLGTSTIQGVVGQVIKAFLGIIGTISLVMFIYGGMLMLTSAGAAEKIKKGQQTLVWASLGILVVFASYAILKFVFSAFGL